MKVPTETPIDEKIPDATSTENDSGGSDTDSPPVVKPGLGEAGAVNATGSDTNATGGTKVGLGER